MRKLRRVLAAVVIAAGLFVGLAGTAELAHADDAHPYDTDTCLNDAAYRVLAFADKTLAGHSFADSYAGGEITHNGVTFHFTSTPTSTETSVLTNATYQGASDEATYGCFVNNGQVPMSTDVVPNTLAALNATDQTVIDDPNLPAQGITVDNAGYDLSANTATIQLDNATPDQVATVQAAYPGAEVTNQGMADDVDNGDCIGSTCTSDRRATDTTAWYGGDFLRTPGGGGCSSAFQLHDSAGIAYTTTAGHCGGGLGSTYQNWRYQTTQGTVWHTNAIYDLYLIRQTGLNATFLWGDSQFYGGTSPTRGVYAVENPYVGELLCDDGAITRERCYMAVRQIQYGKLDGVHYSHQIAAQSVYGNSSQYGCRGGDSGGAMYRVIGGSHVSAVGLLRAQGVYAGTSTPNGWCYGPLVTEAIPSLAGEGGNAGLHITTN